MNGSDVLEMGSVSETDGETVIRMIEEEVVDSEKLLSTNTDSDKEVKAIQVEFNGNTDTLFFNDGVRRIDFILVYEDEDKEELEKTCAKHKKWREEFEANLMEDDLELEKTQSVDKKLMFVKVHMPWDVLCTFAEDLRIKSPFQINDLPSRPSLWRYLSCITKHFYPDERLIHTETEYFTAPFKKDRLESYCIKDRDKFFTPALRSWMAFQILSRALYDYKNFGITKLLDRGVYKAAYPLHDCRFDGEFSDNDSPNERYLLFQEWAHPKSFYKMQPLDLIRKYYGEKVGIYFAWLGFYTTMLTVAAVVGLVCSIYGYMHTSTWSEEVCNPEIGGQIVMCPQCDQDCKFWRLNSTCEVSKKLSLFDNSGTLVFAVFMSVWVTLFLELWKRYQTKLEYEWDTVEYLEEEELPRPEYEDKCVNERKNPITGETEYVPYSTCGRCVRLSIGMGTVMFWIMLVIASIVAIIIYRLFAFLKFSITLQTKDFKELEPLKDYVTPQRVTSVTASLINFVVIMILNKVYDRVAIWITDFELPRTATKYENSLTLKMFLFQFVNFYSSCFYIAFGKGKAVGYPGKPVYFLEEYRNEECDPGGCLFELTTELFIIMGGKAIWNNVEEVLLPWLKNLYTRHCSGQSGTSDAGPRWEQDYQLQPFPEIGIFYEYLEMVIQFGFVTLFVASFPLAPVLALVNNLIEIRVDAWKITTQFRRMVPEKASTIGAWQPILQGIAILAVVTNAMIIAFTSDIIPRLLYYWQPSVYQNVENHTMIGYINHSLSIFNISDFSEKSRPLSPTHNITTCRYRDYRYPPGHPHEYKHTIYYWHVIAAKMAFIIVVEHIVYFTKFVLSYVIPDVPYAVKEQIKHEKRLSQNHFKTDDQ